MASIARKSDGRRIFTREFKRKQIGRLTRGELTIAELGRKLGIAPSLLHRWRRQMSNGNGAGPARPASRSEQRDGEYVRALQVLVGKQTVEIEILRGEVDALRKGRSTAGRYRR